MPTTRTPSMSGWRASISMNKPDTPSPVTDHPIIKSLNRRLATVAEGWLQEP